MVITPKHHDGFAMFRSDFSKYNVYDATPFHRDAVGELAAAAVYGAKPSPYSFEFNWGSVTAKSGRAFLTFVEWPE
jgi:hypothetical protein